jgi:hypothetical protein
MLPATGRRPPLETRADIASLPRAVGGGGRLCRAAQASVTPLLVARASKRAKGNGVRFSRERLLDMP